MSLIYTLMNKNKDLNLVHILVDNRWDIASGLVVAEEGPFECPLIQQINRMSFERVVFVGHSDEHCHAPTL